MAVQLADDVSSHDFQLTIYRRRSEFHFGLHGMFLNDLNDLNGTQQIMGTQQREETE
jgi:hypothetical protein